MHNLFLLLLLPSVVFGAKAPNFVIIYADDLGYSQLSVPMMKDKPEYAHPLHQTPNIAKLAKRGNALFKCLCAIAGVHAIACKYSIRNDYRACRVYFDPRCCDEQARDRHGQELVDCRND